MTRTLVLLLVFVLVLAGCGGGRSSSDVEDEISSVVKSNTADYREGIAFRDISCVHAVGNEWRCHVDFNTSEGPMRASGVATCEDKCLWRFENITGG